MLYGAYTRSRAARVFLDYLMAPRKGRFFLHGNAPTSLPAPGYSNDTSGCAAVRSRFLPRMFEVRRAILRMRCLTHLQALAFVRLLNAPRTAATYFFNLVLSSLLVHCLFDLLRTYHLLP